MKNGKNIKILSAMSRYFTFFLLAAFVTTCCLMLFVTTVSETLELELNDRTLNAAAKLTFVNVILISFIFTVIDTVRRKFTVERPVKRISEATEKMINGNFDVRIPTVLKYVSDDNFNEIIGCINKMAEELSGVESLRSDFIANVSHEMKTPLSVIQNYGILLQSDNISDEKRIEYAKAVTDSSRRLADMITNILKLNRLENQQIYPKTESYDLGEQLCEGLLQYENVWENKNIEIDTEIENNVYVIADKELLYLVWNNLFSNAFKFTENGGRVSLSLTADDSFATVKISDNGCGMSSDVGEHIFEKFYQGDTSHATQGNGLGLALVKRVIDIMKGEICVESALGIGTTFTVKIRRSENGSK